MAYETGTSHGVVASDSANLPVGRFTGNCGENNSATAVDGGLFPNQQLELNGNTDLSSCVLFNDGGKVYGIWLSTNSGFYNYAINVDAEGPHGPFSGSGYLFFTDATGDTYQLSIYSGTRANHFVRYNSDKPQILKVRWSDNND